MKRAPVAIRAAMSRTKARAKAPGASVWRRPVAPSSMRPGGAIGRSGPRTATRSGATTPVGCRNPEPAPRARSKGPRRSRGPDRPASGLPSSAPSVSPPGSRRPGRVGRSHATASSLHRDYRQNETNPYRAHDQTRRDRGHTQLDPRLGQETATDFPEGIQDASPENHAGYSLVRRGRTRGWTILQENAGAPPDRRPIPWSWRHPTRRSPRRPTSRPTGCGTRSRRSGSKRRWPADSC